MPIVTRDIHVIEAEVQDHFVDIASLCVEGAWALAYAHASGQEILRWLTNRGMSDADARTLCVQIVHQWRAEREATTH